MSDLFKIELAALCMFALVLAVGKLDHKSAKVTAAHEREAQEKKADVKPADVVWLRLPLECEQWLAMRGAGQQWKTRPVCADLSKRTP